ncbi:toprim domain-containing protein [Spiroplasma endosymbiont of Labia minor]|uniref:toprim domain-containing protein n=1 Tax=Spiroplasma endosymbiont of Labia minor TaxID=3066305 RepID=UPI0030D2D846
MNKLVILESSNKIKKVSTYLNKLNDGNQYIVKASVGHVRELAQSGIYNIGIDFNTVEPNFIISKDKNSVVNELKTLAKQVD